MKIVLVVIGSRANFGRSKAILDAIIDHPNLELRIVLNGSSVLYRYGKVSELIYEAGYPVVRELYHMVEGGTPLTQSISTGLGIIELSNVIYEIQPDLVFTIADRFETMSTAISCTYQNIPLAHVQGGEISGNIDELVRHSVTKLAHYHFPATRASYERILKLGEEKNRVCLSGCPSIDTIINQDLSLESLKIKILKGVGEEFDFNKRYVLVIFHPETEHYLDSSTQTNVLLQTIKKYDKYHKIVLWPNIDAGTDGVSKTIRKFRETESLKTFTFIRNLDVEDYNIVLNNASVCIGNSSSFIREASHMGTPSVIIGDRQNNREHDLNAFFCPIAYEELENAINFQLEHGRYNKSLLFGNGEAGKIIADYIANNNLNINKKMTY